MEDKRKKMMKMQRFYEILQSSYQSHNNSNPNPKHSKLQIPHSPPTPIFPSPPPALSKLNKRIIIRFHQNVKLKQKRLTTAYNNKMSEQQFNLDDSQENLIVPADWLPRQKSNDSIFGELIRAPSYGERPLIFQSSPMHNDQIQFPKIFKPKEKKMRVKKPCDYRKNICGYITKKIIREYLSPTYKIKVEELCDKYGCDYPTSKSYFLSRIERITGPSHVPSLFVANQSWEKPIKAAFREFFIWFTKERYLRYLILEGKMEQKEAYIEYKNTVLMSLVSKSEEKERELSGEGSESCSQ